MTIHRETYVLRLTSDKHEGLEASFPWCGSSGSGDIKITIFHASTLMLQAHVWQAD